MFKHKLREVRKRVICCKPLQTLLEGQYRKDMNEDEGDWSPDTWSKMRPEIIQIKYKGLERVHYLIEHGKVSHSLKRLQCKVTESITIRDKIILQKPVKRNDVPKWTGMFQHYFMRKVLTTYLPWTHGNFINSNERQFSQNVPFHRRWFCSGRAVYV